MARIQGTIESIQIGGRQYSVVKVVHWLPSPQSVSKGLRYACGLRTADSSLSDFVADAGHPERVNCEACRAWMEANEQ